MIANQQSYHSCNNNKIIIINITIRIVVITENIQKTITITITPVDTNRITINNASKNNGITNHSNNNEDSNNNPRNNNERP